MAEYWKSTPKYWCKHCSTYVKDTKFERTQHEATGRHQGNLKRFLRGIQNDHEKNEREKQRAKSEVDRLNRAVGEPPISSALGNAQLSRRTISTSASQATIADRKRQMAQLAEMGVSVPDEHRGETALAGGWQVVSQRAIEPDDQALKESSLSVGVRKRKFEGQEEEEEEAGETIMKKGWGSTTKEYPSDTKQGLEALLASSIPVKKEDHDAPIKKEDLDQPAADDHVCYNAKDMDDTLVASDSVQGKQKVSGLLASPNPVSDQLGDTPKTTTEAPVIVFKKRKSKNSRER